MSTLLKNRPDLSLVKLEQTQAKMNSHVRDCLIVGYEDLVENLKLPDPSDRHILAAAIKVKAQTILTYNLSDFPSELDFGHSKKGLT